MSEIFLKKGMYRMNIYNLVDQDCFSDVLQTFWDAFDNWSGNQWVQILKPAIK